MEKLWFGSEFSQLLSRCRRPSEDQRGRPFAHWAPGHQRPLGAPDGLPRGIRRARRRPLRTLSVSRPRAALCCPEVRIAAMRPGNCDSLPSTGFREKTFTFLPGPQSLPDCKKRIGSVCNRECVFAVSNELHAILKNDAGRGCLFRMLLRLSPCRQ